MRSAHRNEMDRWRQHTGRSDFSIPELGAWQVGLHDGEHHALGWFMHPWRFRRWLTSRHFWRMVVDARRDRS